MSYLKAYIGGILHAGYIAPTANRNLLILYIGAALGVFGIAFLDVFMSVNLYSFGLFALVSYFTVRIVGNSMIGMPIGFHLLEKYPPKTLLKAGGLYLVATITPLVLLQDHIPVYLTAALASFIYVPFWLVYHSSMLRYSSTKNRGNEIAVGHLCMALGGIAGATLAGIVMYYNMSFFHGCIIGFLIVATATASLISFAHRNNLFTPEKDPAQTPIRLMQALCGDKELAALTSLSAAHIFITGALWPVWLTIIGASGLAVGLLYASTIGLKLLVSPIVGHIANLRRSSDLKTGIWIQTMGWLPWLFSLNPLTTLLSSTFFSGGAHFFNVGLETRWYDTKTYTHLAAREIQLSIGRLIAVFAVIPVLFFAPHYFVMIGLILSAILWGCIHKVKS